MLICISNNKHPLSKLPRFTPGWWRASLAEAGNIDLDLADYFQFM